MPDIKKEINNYGSISTSASFPQLVQIQKTSRKMIFYNVQDTEMDDMSDYNSDAIQFWAALWFFLGIIASIAVTFWLTTLTDDQKKAAWILAVLSATLGIVCWRQASKRNDKYKGLVTKIKKSSKVIED